MGDELDPELQEKPEMDEQEDPLAELARIVAGEPEPESVADDDPVDESLTTDVSQVQASEADLEEPASDLEISDEQPSDLTSQPEPQDQVEVQAEEAIEDVESALESVERELEAAMTSDSDDALEIPEQSEPAVEAAIETEVSCDAISAEETADIVTNALEETTDTDLQVETNDEGSFQDDLISALQEEIGQPTSQEVIDEAGDETFTEDEVSVLESELDIDDDSLEDELQQALQEQLSSDSFSNDSSENAVEVDVPEIEETIEVSTSSIDEEIAQPDTLPDELVDQEAVIPEQETSDHQPAEASTHSLDDDLGAVFASEFEQLQNNAPQEGTAVFEEFSLVEEPLDDVPPASDIPQEALEQEVTEPTDLDFGAAFAEELGVDAIAEAEGWSSADTAAANADFAAAVQPAMEHDATQSVSVEADTELNETELALQNIADDPGHMGVIPAAGADQAGHEQQDTKGGSLKYAIVAVAIALLAGSAVTVYSFIGDDSSTGGPGEPKLIAADSEPFKVTPKDPGGRVPANQDKASYEKVEGTDTAQVDQDRLISDVEEPARLNSESDIGIAPASNLEPKSDERLTASDETTTADTNASGAVTPRVVQTVTVKPDGTIVTTPAPSLQNQATQNANEGLEIASNAVSNLAATGEQLVEGVLATPKPVETVSITKPESIDGASSSGAIAVPQASPLPKPQPAAIQPAPVETAAATQVEQPVTQAVRKSEWVVQVSSQRSPEAAQASFQNLRNRFSALQGRAMSIQKANVDGSTFYRVRVQTASRDDANGLCNSLKASGGSCFVTR